MKRLLGTVCLLFVASMSLMPNNSSARTGVTSENSFRVISSWTDHQDLSVAPFLDILNITIETDGSAFLRFNMTLRGSLPDSHSFMNRTVDDNLSYAWWIDADRNSTSGQHHQYVGSEYNVMFQASGGSPTGEWGARVDVTAAGWSGGGQVQFTINDNKVTLLVGLTQIGSCTSFDWSSTTWGRLNGSSLGSNPETAVQTASVQETPGGNTGVSEVRMTPLTLELRDGMATGRVRAIALDANGVAYSSESLNISYISDNPLVVVGSNGNVTAQGFGTAHIRANINGTYSTNLVTVNFGQLSIRPSILLLSVHDNPSSNLSVFVRNADGSAPLNSTLSIDFRVSGGSTAVATVSHDGIVTAHRPPATFGETPYVSATVNGVSAHNSAVIRVTNNTLGLNETEYSGTSVSFYSPPTNGMRDYNKTIYENEIVRLTDIAYSLMTELTGVVPYSGDTQFLVVDPGADDTVPYGLAGNPIRLGVAVDTGNSGFITGTWNLIPVWWVFFHEMGHSFLGEGVRISQFVNAPTGRSSPYGEAFASILGMYSAAMMDQRKKQYGLSDAILQTQTLLPTYHLSSTPDLDNYRLANNYSQFGVSVVYDIILLMARTYGFDKLVRFFSIFLPQNQPFPFRISSDEEQATFFVAALGSAVQHDLRQFFMNLNVPVNQEFYAEAKNVTDQAVTYRDPNAQPGLPRTVRIGALVQLDGSASYDMLNSPLTYNWTVVSKPVNSNATLSDWNSTMPTFVADTSGNYTFSLVVSNGLFVGSSKEIVITATDLVFDVAVASVSPYRTILSNKTIASVNVTLANHGDVAMAFNATLSYNSTVIETKTVYLESKNSTMVMFCWNTTGLPLGNYTVTATADEVPGETDVLDNSFSYGIQMSVLGDVNGDWKVDMKDVSKVAAGFQTHPEDTKWTANGDLDENGVIDMKDISTIAKHFGEHYP
jgi:hypothetical protein